MTATNTVDDKNLQQQTDSLRLSDPDLQQEEEQQTNTTQKNLINNNDKNRSPAAQSHPYRFIPMKMGGSGRTHVVSEGSASLIENEVSLDDLQRMTELFYDKAFADQTLDKFIRSHNDPHGARFAKWIHQKLSGSNVWNVDRSQRDLRPVPVADGYRHVVHDRSSAHVAAWYSPKRPREEVGRHFKLDECRVWMRLHFWALRESGLLEKSPSFADYYMRFIGHFMRVYESTAPMFARDSFRWSADPNNTNQYIQNGRVMTDVLGLEVEEARNQLPQDEANDFEWPYNQTLTPSQ